MEGTTTAEALAALPNLCAHEHWGSLACIGTGPEGFRADCVPNAQCLRPAGILDLVLDPYLESHLQAAGWSQKEAQQAGFATFYEWAAADLAGAWQALKPALQRQFPTGAWQVLRKGVERLYGVDLQQAGIRELRALDETIRSRYGRLFDWYAQAAQQANFSGVITPVQPEYYLEQKSQSPPEDWCRTLLRVDPFIQWWQLAPERRKKLAEAVKIVPHDAPSWREFLQYWFDLARGQGAVGIKQLQAYTRSLDFRPRSEGEVTFTEPTSEAELGRFQDWVVHEACKLAHELNWPHQVHVGTANLPDSSPLPLVELAGRYPRQKLVLLHCWPYLEEAGWLAKYLPNVYLDTCWQVVLSPEFHRSALRLWLQYGPAHKIMCAHDATSIEQAVGSAWYVRKLLQEALEVLPFNEAERLEYAKKVLQANALAVYDLSPEDLAFTRRAG